MRLLLVLLILISLTGCATAPTPEEMESRALVEGQGLISLGEYEKSIEVYDKALASHPSESLEYNKMLCLAYLGRWDEAEVISEKYPDSLLFLYARLEFLKQQEKTEEAMAFALHILEIDPYYPEVALFLLDLYVEQGLREEAVKLARTLLEREICIERATEVLLSEKEDPEKSS